MEVKTEITKEQYDELVVLRYPERYKRIEDSLPPQWIYGYGYYGNRLYHEGGKYYLVHDIGNTCD